MKPSRTLPTEPRIETETIEDIMPAMDAGNTLVEGVTYKEYPVTLDSSALVLEGTLEFVEVADSGINDLDFYLFDPDGNQIGLSGVAGGPEYIKVVVTRPGIYTWRVTGYANTPATIHPDEQANARESAAYLASNRRRLYQPAGQTN